MQREEMKSFIDTLYETATTDLEKALELYIHDDFFIEEAAELPMAGTYRGKDGLREVFAKTFAAVDSVGLARDFFMAGDDCCASKVVFQLADPDLDPIELLEFFRFKDGKVIEIRPYYFSPGQFQRAAASKARSGSDS